MLGKNRLIFPGEKVLLAWSGGPSSSSMVWQVLEGLSQDSAKRLRFVPGVVYVDEGAACGQSPEDRAKTLAEVKSVLQNIGFPWHTVALEEVFGLPPAVLQGSAQEPVGTEEAYKSAVDSFLQQQHVLGGEQTHQPHTQDSPGPCSLGRSPTATQTAALCRLFDSVRTLTAKEELLQTLRTHLILHVARVHGYSKVMTGDSCTRLAIKLMTNLALGRGAFLAWDTGFSDERHGDVVVVRPMRDHTLKEVAFYNRLFAVPSIFTPAIDTKAPEKASIHRLMEAFILRLQTQFPSTISTVYRTSEKLVKAPREGRAAGPAGPRCLLCLCALDVDTDGLHLGCWVGEGVGVGSGAPGSLCLQTVPQLLELRPRVSPRHCCPPRQLRLGQPQGLAALQGRARPAAGQPATQLCPQEGCPGPGHGTAVLWLPGEHEGPAFSGLSAPLHPGRGPAPQPEGLGHAGGPGVPDRGQ
ncbi:cytosolic thiouridylase subunit 2, transcript variant X2 [Ictidomys tridecemlineatus]|nr:cytosolic thiouridylase subunit 2, transcript variant X2 [Ictidomys tridecemlineatus]